MWIFKCLMVVISTLSLLEGKSFDWTTGNTSLWLSAGAYCETNTYMNRPYKGPSSGFVPTFVLDDKSSDTQGYIGYMPSQSTIFVVYRGSTSIKDWANNVDVILTGYPKCSKCEVHKGFYKEEQGVIATITAQVKSLKAQFPSYSVVVTGHSLGAALATLTALDFLDSAIGPVRLFNFGSPRVGNTDFANFASAKLGDRNRNTHHKDMVPHIPMHERFTHISGEWYEDDMGLRECVGLEDDTCSYQWHITSIDDHMTYLGLYMGCSSQ